MTRDRMYEISSSTVFFLCKKKIHSPCRLHRFAFFSFFSLLLSNRCKCIMGKSHYAFSLYIFLSASAIITAIRVSERERQRKKEWMWGGKCILFVFIFSWNKLALGEQQAVECGTRSLYFAAIARVAILHFSLSRWMEKFSNI